MTSATQVHINSGFTVPEQQADTSPELLPALPPAPVKPTVAETQTPVSVPLESITTPPETTVVSQSGLLQKLSDSEGQSPTPNEQSSSQVMPQDPPIPKGIPPSPPEPTTTHSPEPLSSSPGSVSPLSTTDFGHSPATSFTIASTSIKKKLTDEHFDTPSHVEKRRQFSMDVIDPALPSLKKGRASPSVKSMSSSVHSDRRPPSIASVARNTSRSLKRLIKGSSADSGKLPNGASPSVESLGSTQGKQRSPSIASASRSNSWSWKVWKKDGSSELLASPDNQPTPSHPASDSKNVGTGADVASGQAGVLSPAEPPKSADNQQQAQAPAKVPDSEKASPLKKRFTLGSKSSKTNLRQAALKKAYEKGR